MTTSSPRESDHHGNFGYEINTTVITEILLKHKWLILGGSFACALIVGLYSFLSPRRYVSEALILVSPPIVKPGLDSDEGTQVSEIILSSLEPSTYEVLAKSNELMLALADTLKMRSDSGILSTTLHDADTHSLASFLTETLEIELIQDTGMRNVRSTTPLLALRYESNEMHSPPIVVNTWAELFLQRNQGLSSNVTDSFYKNVVLQYEIAKSNLERTETTLFELDASSNELNRLQTEIDFTSAQLDSSLVRYQEVQTSLQHKEREYDYVNNILSEIQDDGRWIGYNASDVEDNLKQSPMRNNLIDVAISIESLTQDSLLIASINGQLVDSLKTEQNLVILEFEKETNKSYARFKAENADSLIKKHIDYLVRSGDLIDSLKLEVMTTQHILSEEAPLLLTRKAIGDNALWNSVDVSGKTNIETQEKLGNYRLISEEINPTHRNLSQLLSETKKELRFVKDYSLFIRESIDSLHIDFIELNKKIAQTREMEFSMYHAMASEFEEKVGVLKQELLNIEQQLDIKRKTFQTYKTQYEEFKIKSESLEREISELELSTNYYKKSYFSWRDQLAKLLTISDSLSLERRRLNRDLEVYTESFGRLSKLKEEARIARQQASGDIQILSQSKFPQRKPKDTIKKMFISTVVSFLIFCLALLVKKVSYQKTSIEK